MEGLQDLEHTTCYLLWAPHCSLEAFKDVVLVMGALIIRPVKVFPKRCVHTVFLIMVPNYCFVLRGGPQNWIEDKVILGNPYYPSRSSSNKVPNGVVQEIVACCKLMSRLGAEDMVGFDFEIYVDM